MKSQDTMIDCLVIGGGIIGSWVAYLASQKGLSVAVCDLFDGKSISERNSGVLHAGIYYPENSLKAFHCVRGRELAEDFFKKNSIPYSICGKLIVGHSADEEQIHTLLENGKRNGSKGLELTSRLSQFSDRIRGSIALHSTRTGVVDVSEYLRILRHLCELEGVTFLRGQKVIAVEGTKNVLIQRPDGEDWIQAQYVVNAAGLHSDEIARLFGFNEFEIRPNRGEYYRLTRPLPIQKLIYPVPKKEQKGALGVHYTFHLNGEAYAGPNSIQAEHKQDYSITASAQDFQQSLSQILDGYPIESFQTGYSGLRPRLYDLKGNHISDFKICESPAGVWHLLGIESPGLTSSPSLARAVVEKF